MVGRWLMLLRTFFALLIAYCVVKPGLAQAQCARTFTGRLNETSPTQLGRHNRYNSASTCSASKGKTTLNETTNPHVYGVHSFTNTSGTLRCLYITLSWTGTGELWTAAYAGGSYNPLDIAAGWLGDPGDRLISPMSMSVPIGANSTVDVVVYAVSAGSVGISADYTLSGSSCDTSAVAAVTSAPNPSMYGENVSLSATVSATTGSPTGTVTFYEGPTALGSALLEPSGHCTLATSALTPGEHTLTAAYGGDTRYAGVTSPAAIHTVNRANTTAVVRTSQSPALSGTPVNLTAIVEATAPGRGKPTGNVVFLDGTAPLGTVQAVDGIATLSTSTLTAGDHNILATYDGDETFSASASTPILQRIVSSGPTLAATLDRTTSTYGQNVTVTVTAKAANGNPASGQITFSDGGSPLGTRTLDASGKAELTLESLATGTHPITAAYGSSGGALSATAVLSVNPRPTTTVLASSGSPSRYGEFVTLTATTTANAIVTEDAGAGEAGVSDAGASGLAPITGTVTFYDGQTVLGVANLDSGTASLTLATLLVGTHELTATYSGAASYAASTSAPAVSHVITALTGPDPGTTDAGPDGSVSDANVEASLRDVSGSDVSSQDVTSLSDVVVDTLVPNPATDGSTNDVSVGPNPGAGGSPNANTGVGGAGNTLADASSDALPTDARIGSTGGNAMTGDAAVPNGERKNVDLGCGCRVVRLDGSGAPGIGALGLLLASLFRRRRRPSRGNGRAGLTVR